MSLFIIVMAIASGAFVQGIRAQRDVVSSTAANSNITQALERMSREIRTGHTFAGSIPTTASVLSFVNSKSEEVRYTLTANIIKRCVVTAGVCTYVPITSDNIYVNYMTFSFVAAEIASGPTSTPRITIVAGVKGIKNSIVKFQTTVASRIIGI